MVVSNPYPGDKIETSGIAVSVTSHNIAMPVAGLIVSIYTIPQACRYGS
jgi:hypothetical protein